MPFSVAAAASAPDASHSRTRSGVTPNSMIVTGSGNASGAASHGHRRHPTPQGLVRSTYAAVTSSGQ